MELVDGEPLDRRLATRGTFAWRDAVKLAVEASRAVEAAHLTGVIHRDIKPQNLMLTAQGGVKLLDFGVAKRESEIEKPSGDDVEALSVIGTPEYMAPEQARGAADARSDVYALAGVLYELMTGALPHQGSSTAALIERKLSGPPEPASLLHPEAALPRELDRVLAKAMMPEPDARFEDMADFRSALERVLDGRARGRSIRRGVGLALVGAVTFAAAAVVSARTPLLRDTGAAFVTGLGHRALEQAARLVHGKHASGAPIAPATLAAVEAGAAPTVAELAAPPSVTTFGEDTEAAEATKPPAASEEPVPAPAPVAANEASDEGSDAAASAEAVEPEPSSPASALLARFEELHDKGRTLKALGLIRSAARTFPREPAVLRAYVKAAEESKAFGEARKAAQHWAEVDKSTDARLTLARLERATGNSPKAFAILDSVLKADESSEEAHRLAALWSRDQRLAVNR
jgi:serine/threonine-protein kinase